MAVGLPAKTTYADGDVFSASDINDTNGTLNLVGQTTNFYSGKNKIINGDFGVWQRGTSFVNPLVIYSADRWLAYANSTNTVSRQTFTPGTAPVAGYEGQFFLRIDKAAVGTFTSCTQRIEDVRTFAGQTVTVSFWAKASAAVTLTNGFTQNFGSGGSASVDSFPATVSVTTSWARYSYTLSIPSISGKTVGSSSYLAIDVGRALTSSAIVLDIWGVQVEAGSVATAFQTATGTIQGELAACQRYYWRRSSDGVAYATYGSGVAGSTTFARYLIQNPVPMRAIPTSLDYANLVNWDNSGYIAIGGAGPGIEGATTTTQMTCITVSASGLTAYRPYYLSTNNSTASYIGLSAEL